MSETIKIIDAPVISTYANDPQMIEVFLREGADDEGNAQCVRRIYGSSFLCTEGFGWLRYTGTHWTPDSGDAELERAITEILLQRRLAATTAQRENIVKATRPSAHNVRACKYMLGSILRAETGDFDSMPDYLNVANGLLDLRTGTLEPHDPTQRFTYCLPTPYDPDCDTSEWENWILQATGNDESVALYLQMAMGYTLTGHTWEEVLFYVQGPPRAGKGTLTETVLTLLDREPLATEAPFTTFTRNRDNDANSADLAKLKPCRLVVASESGRDQWLDSAELKRITGGNLIFCALKHRDHFSYRPQYKIWLVSNHLPRVDVEDSAAWARIRLISFPNSYLGKEDKRLKARMRTPEVQQKVLTWAVQGAMMWYGCGATGLPTPPKVEEETQAARDQLDYVGQWLTECVEKTDNPDHFVSNPTLYASYEAWCNNTGTTPKKITGLTQAMRAKGYKAGERRRIGDKQARGCAEIQLVAMGHG